PVTIVNVPMVVWTQGGGVSDVGMASLGPFFAMVALAVCCRNSTTWDLTAFVSSQNGFTLCRSEQSFATVFVQDNIRAVPHLTGQDWIAEHRVRGLGVNRPPINSSWLLGRPWLPVHVIGVPNAVCVGFGMFGRSVLPCDLRGLCRVWHRPIRSVG